MERQGGSDSDRESVYTCRNYLVESFAPEYGLRSTVYCPRCLCILHPRIFHDLISKSCVTSSSVCVCVREIVCVRESERKY